jgi:UDP:flavonoid glycosyltransferase YjiC (YdhE family)
MRCVASSFGSAGEALRCGRPVVGVPFAYEQLALCADRERLGVGVRVRQARRTQADFARVLARVLSDAALARRAAEAGRRFAGERDGAEAGADAIEALVARDAPRAPRAR